MHCILVFVNTERDKSITYLVLPVTLTIGAGLEMQYDIVFSTNISSSSRGIRSHKGMQAL